MVRDDIFHHFEPERRDLVENKPFIRNPLVHYNVKGRNPVGSHQEQRIAKIYDSPDLAENEATFSITAAGLKWRPN